MVSKEDNKTLTGVSPGTPLHPFLARFWHPVLNSTSLADRHTRRVRLLGENFVVARQGSELIALDELCPHRLASLTLARVEDRGLRCIYHGWLIDRDGSVAEAPNERETGGRNNVRVRAPLVRELGGLIWMNICESEAERAPFPDLPWLNLPAANVLICEVMQAGNWVQALEGAIDSSHSSHLHSSELTSVADLSGSHQVGSGASAKHARPSVDKHPRIQVRDTDFGFVYGALRKPMVDPESTMYVRATAFAYPSFVTFPANATRGDMQMFVPIDETNTHFFYIRYFDHPIPDRDGMLARSGLIPGVHLDENNHAVMSSLPGWGQDRQSMAAGHSFTGIQGVNLQDIAVQESMGPIVDRSREHLGAADLAIVHFRRLLLSAAKGEGAAQTGFVQNINYRGLRARDGLMPVTENWTALYKAGEVNWLSASVSS